MALGYRRDPVVDALSEVGGNIRQLSADILSRRRLDIAEGQQIAEAERERGLAELRAQAQRQSGETELLKTRGSLAELGQRMTIQQAQEGRAAEMHGPQLALLGENVETARFQRQRGQEMLPLEKGAMRANINQSNAAAGASAAAARASNLRSEQMQMELNFLRQPVNDGQVAGMVQGLYGDAGLQAFTSMVPPGTVKSMGDLISAGNLIAKGLPDNLKDVMVDQMTTRIAQMPADDQQRQQLEQHRAMLLQNKGISLGKNISPEDLSKMAIEDSIRGLEGYASRQDRNPEVIKQLYRQFEIAQKLESTHRKPEDAMTAQASRVLSIEQEFLPIAKRLVEADAKKQGLDDPTQIATAVRAMQRDLILTHGTPEAYMASLQQSQAPGTSPQATTPTVAPRAGDVPVTPGAEAVRRQQRARLSGLAAAGRSTEATAQAGGEFDRFARNQAATGVSIPAGREAEAKSAYIAMRQANPGARPVEVLQQVIQSLR